MVGLVALVLRLLERRYLLAQAIWLAGLAGLILLAYALYVQFGMLMLPCPLCILQRLAFAAMGIVFLVGGLHSPKGKVGRAAYGLLAFAAAAAGLERGGADGIVLETFHERAELQIALAAATFLSLISMGRDLPGNIPLTAWLFLGVNAVINCGFGLAARHEEKQAWLTRVLHRTGRLAYHRV